MGVVGAEFVGNVSQSLSWVVWVVWVHKICGVGEKMAGFEIMM